MNPKKTLLVILASIVLVGLVRVALPYLPTDTEETEDTYEPEIKYLEENHIEVFLLGDEILLEEGFPYKKIQKIEEAKGGETADYIFLIINNLHNNGNLTLQDVKALKKRTDTDTKFNFIYLGADYRKVFIKSGVFRNKSMDCIAEGEMSFCSAIMEGERTGYGGLWDEDSNEGLKINKYLLGQSLLRTIVEIIKSNE